MINILIVDDEPLILEIQERVIDRYFKKADYIDFTIETAPNGCVALDMMENKEYDMLFLDLMMPKCDGFQVLDTTRITNKDKRQPFICMVTAMGTDENNRLFREKKATSYIYKPFELKTLNLMLDRYILPLMESSLHDEEADEFFDFYDFDEDESFGFDNDSNDDAKEEMQKYNEAHSKITAIEFLKDYDDVDYMLKDIEEIDEMMIEVIEYLDISSFDKYKSEINDVLTMYSTFLNSLSNFDQLSTSFINTRDLIIELDISSYPEKKAGYIIEFIRVILKDISAWKEYVFITKDAVDVYYINASAYNSCIQLKDLVEG